MYTEDEKWQQQILNHTRKKNNDEQFCATV